MRVSAIMAMVLALSLIISASFIGYHRGYLNGYVDAASKACLGEHCVSSDGCRLPMEYALRSNCPYEAVCVDGRCHVACMQPYASESESQNGRTQCSTDGDCTCEHYLGAQMIACRCLEGKCAVVVE
jgi:hypothetical protein